MKAAMIPIGRIMNAHMNPLLLHKVMKSFYRRTFRCVKLIIFIKLILQEYLRLIRYIFLPKIYKYALNVFHHYVIRFNKINREKLIKYLSNKGVQILVHYPRPLYKQKAIKGSSSNFKNTEIA
jgi:dTDP-4-amino-4,6-dideoxygalactose transaminase